MIRSTLVVLWYIPSLTQSTGALTPHAELRQRKMIYFIAKSFISLVNVKSLEAVKCPSLSSAPLTCILTFILKLLVSAR